MHTNLYCITKGERQYQIRAMHKYFNFKSPLIQLRRPEMSYFALQKTVMVVISIKTNIPVTLQEL